MDLGAAGRRVRIHGAIGWMPAAYPVVAFNSAAHSRTAHVYGRGVCVARFAAPVCGYGRLRTGGARRGMGIIGSVRSVVQAMSGVRGPISCIVCLTGGTQGAGRRTT